MRTSVDDLDPPYGLEVREEDTSSPREAAPCPVCRERRVRVRFSLESFSTPVVVCETCGVGRFDPMPGSAEVESFYSRDYYGEPGRKFKFLVEQLVRRVGARHIRFLSRRLGAGARVLDVGCGRGVTLGPLADQGFEVHGVEVSAAAARGTDPRAEIRIAPRLADARYPEAFFRQVVIWHVLEHLPEPRETLREVQRILEPGGRLVVAVPNFSSLQARWLGADWFHLDLPRHLFHFPLPALRRLLGDTGFEVEGEYHFSLRQNPFGWIQSVLNRCSGLPRNGLYRILHQRGSGHAPPFGVQVRVLLYTLMLVLSPFALALSIFAAALRQGATVHLVAIRREETTSIEPHASAAQPREPVPRASP